MILINKTKIKRLIITIILMFGFFEPQYFLSANIKWVCIIYDVFKLFSYFVSAFLFLILVKNKKIPKTVILLIFFIFTLIISTMINRISLLIPAVLYCYNIFSICVCMYYLLLKDKNTFIKGMRFIFNTLVFINFITIIMFPAGMYEDITTNTGANWFLGYDNMHIIYLLPCIFFNYVYNEINKRNSLISYFMISVCYISCIIRFSATSLVGMTILGLYFVPFFKEFIKNNYKKIVIVILVLNFLIVICRIQNVFEYIIVDILGKTLTFTDRVYIWDYVIEFIKNKPLFGYGFQSSEIRFLMTNVYQSYHAHNEILEIIYKSGLIGMSIITFMCVALKKHIYNIKIENIKIIIMVFTIVYLIMFITEYYDIKNFIYLFILAEYFREDIKDD